MHLSAKRRKNNHRAPDHAQAALPALVRTLSPKRQELMRPLLESPRRYVLCSLRDLAKQLDSAPATLLRTVREMGFRSYHDFRRYLHELSITQSTPLDVLRNSGHTVGMEGRLEESLQNDISNLRALSHSLDKKQLIALVKRLHAADSVLILGGDMAQTLTFFLDYTLAVIGLKSVAVTGAGEMTHRIRQVGKRDVVIAISYRRGLRQTVEGLRQAKTRGAYCVGITDSSLSPIARYSDEYFLTSTEGTVFSGSYVAPMAFINLLLLACSNYRRNRTLSIFREAEKEQRTGFRWFSED